LLTGVVRASGDVGRERDLSDLLENFFGAEIDDPARSSSLEDFQGGAIRIQNFARLDPSGGREPRLPQAVVEWTQHEGFDRSAAGTTAPDPGGEYAGVVDHEQLVSPQPLTYRVEGGFSMFIHIGGAEVAAGVRSSGSWLLGDQLRW